MSRKIIKNFKATAVPPESFLSCSALEGCDLAGHECFKVGMPVLNENLFEKNQTVNGVEVVQFTCGDSHRSYCVSRAIYEDATGPIDAWREDGNG